MVNYEYVPKKEKERAELEEGISLLEKSVYVATEDNVTIMVNRVSPHPNPITKVPGEISLNPVGGNVTSVGLRGNASAKIYEVTPYGAFVSLNNKPQDYFIRFNSVKSS